MITWKTTSLFADRGQPGPAETGPETLAAFAARLGFVPDERQAAVLASTARRGIVLCTRQWGKSTVGALKALHRAFTRPESLVLVASPSLRQSGEFLAKCQHFMRPLGLVPRGDGHNPLSLAFPNGSRIVGLPGNPLKIVGFSAVSLLVFDEAALVPDFLYRVLRPMLAVGDGDLWLLSSAWWQEGFFYEAWREAGDWERFCVTATDCPRLGPAFLDEERRVQGEQTFAQQYLCQFQAPEGALVSSDLLDRIWDDQKPEWL